MIIEAARGGHTNVIRVLLDYAPQASLKYAAEKTVLGKSTSKSQSPASSGSGKSMGETLFV